MAATHPSMDTSAPRDHVGSLDRSGDAIVVYDESMGGKWRASQLPREALDSPTALGVYASDGMTWAMVQDNHAVYQIEIPPAAECSRVRLLQQGMMLGFRPAGFGQRGMFGTGKDAGCALVWMGMRQLNGISGMQELVMETPFDIFVSLGGGLPPRQPRVIDVSERLRWPTRESVIDLAVAPDESGAVVLATTCSLGPAAPGYHLRAFRIRT